MKIIIEKDYAKNAFQKVSSFKHMMNKLLKRKQYEQLGNSN